MAMKERGEIVQETKGFSPSRFSLIPKRQVTNTKRLLKLTMRQ